MTSWWPATAAVLLLGCLLPAGAPAGEERVELTVDAGSHDRNHCPVKTLIELPGAWSGTKCLLLTDGHGRTIVAQLAVPGLLTRQNDGGTQTVRELHFVVPPLNKGEQLTFVAQPAMEPPPGFQWRDVSDQYAELSYADRPVMRYVYPTLERTREEGDSFFKVFHHLYSPDGTRFVTKGEKTGLFPHHRGLFYGFSRITYGGAKANTWVCRQDRNASRQSHQGFLASEAGPVLGRHLIAVDWHGPEQEVFAKEQRELSAYHVPGGQLIEFASRMSSTVGKVRLDGDPAHAGFQFRAAQDVVDRSEATYYLRPDGKGRPGEFRNWDAKLRDPRCVNLPWHAMSFVIGPKRYTAVYLDRPDNPRESRYGERDYARIGCYFEYELDQGKDLLLGYRLWLQEGEMTVSQATALHTDFVEPPTVSIRTTTTGSPTNE